MERIIEAFTGLTEGRASTEPAKLDKLLTATGVFLALFMIGHMLLVSSILLGKDVMYSVTKFLELAFIFDGGAPIVVTAAAAGIFIVFAIHGALALKKIPTNYRAFLRVRAHVKLMEHGDTTLWFYQVVTGFIMFFTASIHLYVIMTNPSEIGPYASADRVWSDWMWPLYGVLLVCVEIHGSVGLYRAAMKWGWFDGKDPKATRKRLQKVKKIMSIFFIALGVSTLLTYMMIGYEHQTKAGERYSPVHTVK